VRKLIPQHDVFATDCIVMCWSIDPSSCTLIMFVHQINLGGTRGITAHFRNFWILLGIISILHILQQAPCGNDRFKFIIVDGMNKYIPKPKGRPNSFVLVYKNLVRWHLDYCNCVWNPYRKTIRQQENRHLINYCRVQTTLL